MLASLHCLAATPVFGIGRSVTWRIVESMPNAVDTCASLLHFTSSYVVVDSGYLQMTTLEAAATFLKQQVPSVTTPKHDSSPLCTSASPGSSRSDHDMRRFSLMHSKHERDATGLPGLPTHAAEMLLSDSRSGSIVAGTVQAKGNPRASCMTDVSGSAWNVEPFVL